jgi:uncharacterized protein YciI
MNTLAEEGLVLFAGPLAGSEQSRIRVLLIASALDQEQIHQRLSGDPWEITRRVVTTSIEPWSPLVGAQRLAAPSLPQREAEARSSPQIGP